MPHKFRLGCMGEGWLLLQKEWSRGGSSPECMVERVVPHGLKAQCMHLTLSTHWHCWALLRAERGSEGLTREDREMCSPHEESLPDSTP